MAKKDVTGRLCFEKDFFEASGLNIFQDLVFALTSARKVVIISKFDFDHLNNRENLNLEFLGNCRITAPYYSFTLPENVDTAIGKGDVYYFSIIKIPSRIKQCHMICIYKQHDASASDDTNTKLEESSDKNSLRLEDFEPWIKEDIDD